LCGPPPPPPPPDRRGTAHHQQLAPHLLATGRAGGVGSTELSNFLTQHGLRCNMLEDGDACRHVNRCRLGRLPCHARGLRVAPGHRCHRWAAAGRAGRAAEGGAQGAWGREGSAARMPEGAAMLG